MKALDTNVLVRLLVEDHPGQADQAARVVRRASAAGERLHVSSVVLAELVRVLAGAYDLGREEIAGAIAGLLRSRQLQFGDRDAAARAVAAYAAGKGDFSDYLIREQARDAGCEAVVTFDAKLLREEGFESP